MSWERLAGFAAKHPSVCSRCNRGINVRDRVVWANSRHDEIIHVRCASGADDE